MTPIQLRKLRRELEDFVEDLTEDMGRPERRRAMEQYVMGLLLDGERKSIEPMAARLTDDPTGVEAMRQRLQQCVSFSPWNEGEMFRRVALKLDREMPDVEALVIDDTGFPKKGKHSVGVARQYSGTLGRVDNCQVAVSLHLASEAASGCIGMRLYLSEAWTEDAELRAKVRVPDEIEFQTKWQIALDRLDAAIQWGVRPHVVLADSGYGAVTEFREGLRDRELDYAVAVTGDLVVWPPKTKFAVPKPTKRRGGRGGRGPTVPRGDQAPVSIKTLATSLGANKYRKVTWRQGSRGAMSSRFAAVRIHTAHKHKQHRPPGPEEWLLCEWPIDEPKPTKFYLSSLPRSTSMKQLVRKVKLRWRIERDYQELKGEIGLDHFEGRMWRGFHHHAALCAAAHAFLALRRALSPPEASAMDTADGTPGASADLGALGRRVPAMPDAIRTR